MHARRRFDHEVPVGFFNMKILEITKYSGARPMCIDGPKWHYSMGGIVHTLFSRLESLGELQN